LAFCSEKDLNEALPSSEKSVERYISASFATCARSSETTFAEA